MKRGLIFPAIFVAAVVSLAAAPAVLSQDQDSSAVTTQRYQEYSHARVVRLSLVEGDVQVLRPEAENWENALVNLPILQGYSIAVGRGRAEIEFESGGTARLAEDTLIRFTELALGDGARLSRIRLEHGTATFYANLSRNDVFVVATPHLEAAVPDDARFRVDVLATGSTVSVLKGEVAVETSAGTQRVTRGYALILQDGAANPVTVERDRDRDDWDRWVADRDEVVSTHRYDTERYVRTPFRYGLADLATYGGWYLDYNYGHVWQPFGLSVGWSPYYHGRWVFLHNVGWTWVSYEPWGWVPYHYGRWVLAHRGWVWVPGGFRTWHPGLVHWWNFGDVVGWCPLGPRDRLGIAPNRLPTGPVVMNTPTGVIGGSPNRQRPINPHERPRWSGAAPLAAGVAGRLDFDRRLREREERLGLGEERTPPAGSAPASGFSGTPAAAPAGQSTGAPARVGDVPTGIVYDREERRYVNAPRAPRNVEPESDAPTPRPTFGGFGGRSETTPRAPAAASAPSAPRADSPATPGEPRGGWGGSTRGPVREDRPVNPRPSYTPQPTYTPPPRPSYSPPPRTESPRPAYAPPPRAESPRPAPSSGGGWGSAPARPAPAPAPARPRGEPRPKPQQQ